MWFTLKSMIIEQICFFCLYIYLFCGAVSVDNRWAVSRIYLIKFKTTQNRYYLIHSISMENSLKRLSKATKISHNCTEKLTVECEMERIKKCPQNSVNFEMISRWTLVYVSSELSSHFHEIRHKNGKIRNVWFIERLINPKWIDQWMPIFKLMPRISRQKTVRNRFWEGTFNWTLSWSTGIISIFLTK